MGELKQSGWKVNSHSFATVNHHFNDIGPGFKVPIPIRVAKKSNAAKDSVRDFFYNFDITHEASKGTVKKKTILILDGIEYMEKIDVPMRYLRYSISTCYKLFCDKYENINISETTFRKLKPKEVKTTRRRTDLCGVCENNKKLENKLKN